MSSTVFGVSYDVADAKVAASFWAAALSRSVGDGADASSAVVEPADPASGHAHWVTLADPEGNQFDLIEG
jgi:hypothetical protein